MKQTFGEIIKQIRLEKGMSQEEFARLLGTTKQVLSRYETNQRTPKVTTANEYAIKLNVPLSLLLGDDRSNTIKMPSNVFPVPKMKRIPILGTIACGSPILAEENYQGFALCPENVDADLTLICSGDSMIGARIMDGDIVYIRKQSDVDDGEIAAVLIEDEATLKRVYKIPGRIQLRPENPAYPVMEYSGETLNHIRIIGKAVAFVSAVK